jgi:hypothetical protein
MNSFVKYGVSLTLVSVSAVAVSEPLRLIQKQSNYQIMSEHVTHYVSISGDKYDSYYNVSMTRRSGPVDITVPQGGDGVASFVERPAGRALPVSFDCDYSAGETRGKISVAYRHPRNLYGRITADLEAVCEPLTTAEVAKQTETLRAQQQAVMEEQNRAEAERNRRDEEQHKQAEQVTQLAQQRAADDKRQSALEKTPAYKRQAAYAAVRNLRHQLEQANSAIEEERRVGAVSGYVDATRLHGLGAMVVGLQDEITRQFEIYKGNGGTLRTAEEVK